MKPNAFIFTIETQAPSLPLLLAGVGVMASNMQTRAAVAALCRAYGFDCIEGGRHVAVIALGFGERLAIITNSELPDFN